MSMSVLQSGSNLHSWLDAFDPNQGGLVHFMEGQRIEIHPSSDGLQPSLVASSY